MTWHELGPLKLRAMDADGRLFPCGCHVEPAAWAILAPSLPNGRVVYVTVTVQQRPGFPFAHAFENALNTLADALSDYKRLA